MGLFNSGKREKIDKIEKYEEHHESSSPKKKSHPSSKHPNKNGPIIRSMPQASFLPNFGYSPMKYPFSSNIQFDLSRLPPTTSFPYQQFYQNQIYSPTNFPQFYSNGYQFYNDRSPFQQQQQQNPWSYIPPSTNGYMQPMNF